MSDTSNVEIGDWEGALGPQSEDEPMFYELSVDGDRVRLGGPSPGMEFEYDREEFEELIDDGEWILADDDWENQRYLTPAGEQPY
ncbi:hypothetical protein [Halopelagius longus]|uniref:Uncharacterized protein n=1 Tax=Halopelagius longus TaxID=1236180 RepID=A0A1H0Z8J3_9EURY|nr:hypothetical protein [Halopelagius longus]RDI72884.1 hypothetical protein DWB78_14770 [Halopelagius longus]SDQ23755.1 hypothetical protein SAMN05216278_1079 [Halopelagius longus]